MDHLIPVGYSALVEAYQLKVIPHFRKSYIAESGRGYQRTDHSCEVHVYPKSYALKNPDDPMLQLEFALKYDGVHLSLIHQLFKVVEPKKIEAFISEKKTSKYRRKIWFLYEFLLNTSLDLVDLQNTPYTDLLDSKQYYTGATHKSQRHAVNNNFLGNQIFCPFVRKTTLLKKYENENFNLTVNELVERVDPSVLSRAITYLYTKETQSSFEIERVKPSLKRSQRFIHLLEEAHRIERLDKYTLLILQNSIVEDPYKDDDYRKIQNYVGELTRSYQQVIHYISPRPENIPRLMEGFLDFTNSALTYKTHPVILAAAISFGFVFLHPFEDGNGRIHRFLIHYVLSKFNYTLKDMIFPVSNVMLRDIKEYDSLLESFSKPLLNTIEEYSLADNGELKVHGDTCLHYQYVDYTLFAEYLFKCIEQTIQKDFKEELMFIQNYDKTKIEIQKVIDMPDIKIDRIIRCISQNKGELGKKMKKRYFQELSDQVISKIERLVGKYMTF